MVLYTGLDGRGAFGRCEELSEAVAEVERLRNDQDIEDAQIFRLEEVKFQIKPYFRVELPRLTEPPPVPAPSAGSRATETAAWAPSVAAAPDVLETVPAPPPPPSAVSPAPVVPLAFEGGSIADDEIVGSRRGLFGR
jgi:hypothetical protein